MTKNKPIIYNYNNLAVDSNGNIVAIAKEDKNQLEFPIDGFCLYGGIILPYQDNNGITHYIINELHEENEDMEHNEDIEIIDKKAEDALFDCILLSISLLLIFLLVYFLK